MTAYGPLRPRGGFSLRGPVRIIAMLLLPLMVGLAPEEAAKLSTDTALATVPVESAELLPTFADWPGECRIQLPGVHSTRRVKLDPLTREPLEVTLALVEPLLSDTRAVSLAKQPPKIALTFDDGPDGRYTSPLLDILAEHNARATFFVLGSLVESHGQLLRRMQQSGHEIGIHTWRHANLRRLSDEDIRDDLRRCRNALDTVIERPVRWVRPPYGAVDSRVHAVITAKGYDVALWSVDPHDWRRPGAGTIATRVLRESRDGAVVLLHDGGGDRSGTVEAMRQVVPELQARGFELVTLSELNGIVDPPPTEHGMILTIGDELFNISSQFDDVKVEVDGVELDLGASPMMTRDQFLVPARPVLEALGSEVTWNEESLALGFETVRGDFVVELNTLEITRNGRPLMVHLPSVYYRGVAMLPAWMIANACRAAVRFDSQRRVIEFSTGTTANGGRPAPGHGSQASVRRPNHRPVWCLSQFFSLNSHTVPPRSPLGSNSTEGL